MNIEKIKNELEKIIGKRVRIKVNVGRNKYEYYEGEILKVYPCLFTFSTVNFVKSFSYSDVLTKDIQISLSNS